MENRAGSSRPMRWIVLVSLAVAMSACNGTVSSASSASSSPSPSASPTASVGSVAASYREYAVAACAAWDALFRAVGNPDTASGSVLSLALDKAVAAGDVSTAERQAVDIQRELKAGRDQVAIAGGWVPRALAMAQFDRVFVGFEAMIAAKLAASKRTSSNAPASGASPEALDPQAAFEQAGGADGYFAMFDLMSRASPPPGETAYTCPNVPVMVQ